MRQRYDRAQMLKETGERLIPDRQREELLYAEHVARYRFAAYFAPARRVLDAGSGEGYGTAILAAAGAASVVGLDVDDEVVSAACSLPKACSSFRRRTATNT